VIVIKHKKMLNIILCYVTHTVTCYMLRCVLCSGRRGFAARVWCGGVGVWLASLGALVCGRGCGSFILLGFEFD